MNLFFKLRQHLIYYHRGKCMLNDPHYLEVKRKNRLELDKPISRSQIINFLLSLNKCNTNYLEIGVRNPDDNFNKIKATNKYSVDNGVEFKDNPVDFKMTSDDFFTKLFTGEILSNDIKFDVIFIDGLHLSEQVDRDIINSLLYIKENGFIVIHDCNPISEWNARENFKYMYTPAQDGWLGTTWKAFFKWRQNPSVKSCCIDSDHGVGIITKKYAIGDFTKSINPFFEFHVLDRNRNKHLNLINFEDFKMLFQNT